MRILVFFDLPTITKADKRAYVLFRRFLINDGYDMLQWSVYGRVVHSIAAEKKHLSRLQSNLPPDGSVRSLTVTEKQFAAMKILVGPPKRQEKKKHSDQILLF